MEDAWLKAEREYFVESEASDLGITKKKLNEAILKYNKFLQKALFGNSPFIAEDLKMTILEAGGKLDTKQ